MPFNYTLIYEKIEFAGGDLSVRGLGVPEIAQVVSINTEAAVELFNEITTAAKENQEIDIGALIFALLSRFSTAVAHTIALAADAPDQIAGVSKLPIDVQVEALQRIARLSFAMDGGVKKFWETVLAHVAASKGLSETVQELTATFMNGSGPSEDK
jgi:hypothetical protein